MKTTTCLTAITSLLVMMGSHVYAQTLTDLTLSAGTLNPTFSSGTMNYTATVPYETGSIQVTATAAPGTPIQLNGENLNSGEPSPAQPLNVGTNLLRVAVFGEGAVFYDVVVTRLEAAPPRLTGLRLSDGILAPVFNSETFNYAATVSNSTAEVTVTPTAQPNMIISISGELVVSGAPSSPQPLDVGPNQLTVGVISGETGQNYTVLVTREQAPPPTLTGLSFSDGTLDPAFDGATLDYTLIVPTATTSVTVTATAPADVIISLNGTALTSGQPSPPQNLLVGANLLTITLFGSQATVYDILAYRLPSDLLAFTDTSLQGNTLSLTWVGFGTLQSTTNFAAWTSIPTVSNTHNVDITQAPQKLFRLEQ